MQQGERDFEQISKTIRKEVGRFEASIIILHFSYQHGHILLQFCGKTNLIFY